MKSTSAGILAVEQGCPHKSINEASPIKSRRLDEADELAGKAPIDAPAVRKRSLNEDCGPHDEAWRPPSASGLTSQSTDLVVIDDGCRRGGRSRHRRRQARSRFGTVRL